MRGERILHPPMDGLRLPSFVFKTAGLCRRGKHDLLPASARLCGAMRISDDERHLVLHSSW